MTTNIIDNNLTELVADNGKYITQSAEVWNERVFCKRLVLTPNETTADWRDATEKEKIEYESFTPPRKSRAELL